MMPPSLCTRPRPWKGPMLELGKTNGCPYLPREEQYYQTH